MRTVIASVYYGGVADRQGFHAEVRALLQDRVLDTTAEVIVAEGWGAVTMSRIATQVGVSLQLLYKQIGSRQVLGEAVIARETDSFLSGITACMAEHADDPVAGLSTAAGYTLRTGADNALLKAILAGGNGADGELLALLTTRSAPVLQPAIAAVLAQARDQYQTLGLPADRLTSLVEVFVRLTLSHLLQPSGPIEQAIEQIRDLVALYQLDTAQAMA